MRGIYVNITEILMTVFMITCRLVKLLIIQFSNVAK